MRIYEPVPCHAGEITRLADRDLAQHIKAFLGSLPSLDCLAHAEGFRDAENAFIVGDLILASLKDRSHCGHTSLKVNICAGFLDARNDREVDGGVLGTLNRVVNILNDKELQLLCCRCKCLIVRPTVTRVRAEDPETFDFTGVDSFNDLVVGDRRFLCHKIRIDAYDIRKALSLIFIREVTAAEQAGRVGEETGAHGVALAGDGVAAGAGLSDIACHESEVHDAVRGPYSFVALVDAHGPPERNCLAIMDQVDQLHDLLSRKTCRGHASLNRECLDEFSELIEFIRVLLDELVIDPVFLDQYVGNRVHEMQVTSRSDAIPVIRVLGSLTASRIDNDDLVSRNLILLHSSPDDRVSYDGVREFQILQCVARRVIAVGLLVGDRCRCHTESGVSVDVGLKVISHYMAEDCELFQGELTGADAGYRLSSVLCLEFFDLVRHILKTFLPRDFLHCSVRLTDLGERIRLDSRLLFGQGDALNAAESVVDRIARSGNRFHDSVVFHIKV